MLNINTNSFVVKNIIMEKIFMFIFALLRSIRNVIIVFFVIAIGALVAKFVCNIQQGEAYSWLSGIWHGLFFVPNYIRSVGGTGLLYKATNASVMYDVFYWIFAVITFLGTVPGMCWYVLKDVCVGFLMLFSSNN